MIEVLSHDPSQTVDLGRRLGELARPGDVITLDGELGVGKTQLVRGLAAGMGLDPAAVSSPTYVLMHEYTPEPPDEPTRPVLVHIDAYRLTGPDDLASLGYDDELTAAAVTAVEWADRVADLLGPDRLAVTLEHAGPTSRRVTLTPFGEWVERVAGMGW